MKSMSRLIAVFCLLSLCGCGLFINKIPSGEIPDKTSKDHVVKVKGFDFHYTEYPGTGKDVVLLHGFASSTYTWEKVAVQLNKEGYHVWALDLKGFGWSEKPLDSRYDVGALTEDVDDWMETMKLKKTVFVGNSLGGAITTILSKLHPQRVDKMVLIDAGGYPMALPMVVRMARWPLSSFFGNLTFGRWIVRHNIKQVMFDETKVTDDKVEAYYTRMCTENAIDTQIKTARSIDFNEPSLVARATKGNKTRTLIIWGKDDAWIPLETVGYSFRRDLENSIISVLPDCGHIPQEEQPEKTARLIIDFIKDAPIKDDKPVK